MKKKAPPKPCRTRDDVGRALLDSVRRYQAYMAIRIGVGNRLSAMFRHGLIDAETAKLQAAEIANPIQKTADASLKPAEAEVQTFPVYAQWLKYVRGISTNLSAQLVAHIHPIRDFDNPAKLWAYAGYRVTDGVAQHRERGVVPNWSDDLKVVCYQAGESFVKQNTPPCYYRVLYDRYKARDKAAHPEEVKVEGQRFPMYRPAHMHKRALRYAVKIFLAHLWQVWREIEGLPIRTPYPVAMLGHTTILSPYDAMEKSQSVGDAHEPSASQYADDYQPASASQEAGDVPHDGASPKRRVARNATKRKAVPV